MKSIIKHSSNNQVREVFQTEENDDSRKMLYVAHIRQLITRKNLVEATSTECNPFSPSRTLHSPFAVRRYTVLMNGICRPPLSPTSLSSSNVTGSSYFLPISDSLDPSVFKDLFRNHAPYISPDIIQPPTVPDLT